MRAGRHGRPGAAAAALITPFAFRRYTPCWSRSFRRRLPIPPRRRARSARTGTRDGLRITDGRGAWPSLGRLPGDFEAEAAYDAGHCLILAPKWREATPGNPEDSAQVPRLGALPARRA